MKPADKSSSKKKTAKKPIPEKQTPTYEKNKRATKQHLNKKEEERLNPKEELTERVNETEYTIRDKDDKGLNEEYGLNDENLFML